MPQVMVRYVVKPDPDAENEERLVAPPDVTTLRRVGSYRVFGG